MTWYQGKVVVYKYGSQHRVTIRSPADVSLVIPGSTHHLKQVFSFLSTTVLPLAYHTCVAGVAGVEFIKKFAIPLSIKAR